MNLNIVKARAFIVLTLLFLLSACAMPPPSLPIGKPIPPGYLYKAKFLNIRSPNEKGWYLNSATQSGMQFVRRGKNKKGMFAAQVSTFPLPKFKNADAFLDFIKQSFHEDTDHKRFKIKKSNFKIDVARKYLCVKVSTIVEDKQGLASHHRYGRQMLQSISLYCRHPVNKLAGFAITYSHRGKSLYPGLAKDAHAFIAGVQVPGY